MIQVILAEDHNIVRNGVKMLLETDHKINVAAEAVNGREVLRYIESGGKIDVVLADINMPEVDGISLVKELKVLYPEIKVVILSMHDNEQYVGRAFSAGASGYLLKNVSADELIFALKHAHAGGKYLCAELSIKMLDRLMQHNHFSRFAEKIEFSVREIEIMHLIAEGLTNQEMSEKLFVSKRTVEGLRLILIEKTGSRNTASLIRYAVLNGIVQ